MLKKHFFNGTLTWWHGGNLKSTSYTNRTANMTMLLTISTSLASEISNRFEEIVGASPLKSKNIQADGGPGAKSSQDLLLLPFSFGSTAWRPKSQPNRLD
jgi:hypothetical protein